MQSRTTGSYLASETGDTSPANSASDHEFFCSVCDSSPSTYARPWTPQRAAGIFMGFIARMARHEPGEPRRKFGVSADAQSGSGTVRMISYLRRWQGGGVHTREHSDGICAGLAGQMW